MNKKKLLRLVFITSRFSYCPLTWICHSRNLGPCINKTHKRTLRLVSNDTQNLKGFRDLLVKARLWSIHQRNLQLLATEIFKIKIRIAPEMMINVSQFAKQPYNLRNTSLLLKINMKSVFRGNNTLFTSSINLEAYSTFSAKEIAPSSIQKENQDMDSWPMSLPTS